MTGKIEYRFMTGETFIVEKEELNGIGSGERSDGQWYEVGSIIWASDSMARCPNCNAYPCQCKTIAEIVGEPVEATERPGVRQHVTDAAWQSLSDGVGSMDSRASWEQMNLRCGTMVVTVAEWDSCQSHESLSGLYRRIAELEADNEALRRQIAERDAKDRRMYGPFPSERERQERAVGRLMLSADDVPVQLGRGNPV